MSEPKASLSISPRRRFDRVSWALLIMGIGGLGLCAYAMWTNVLSWRGQQGPYQFLIDLGVDSRTASMLMNLFPNLSPQFLTLGLAALIGLLFVSAVRWQRAHTR